MMIGNNKRYLAVATYKRVCCVRIYTMYSVPRLATLTVFIKLGLFLRSMQAGMYLGRYQ